MTWDYRVIHTHVRIGVDEWEDYFSIHEVYYDEGGAITFYAARAATPGGEHPDGLRSDLEAMLQALARPALESADLPGNTDAD